MNSHQPYSRYPLSWEGIATIFLQILYRGFSVIQDLSAVNELWVMRKYDFEYSISKCKTSRRCHLMRSCHLPAYQAKSHHCNLTNTAHTTLEIFLVFSSAFYTTQHLCYVESSWKHTWMPGPPWSLSTRQDLWNKRVVCLETWAAALKGTAFTTCLHSSHQTMLFRHSCYLQK